MDKIEWRYPHGSRQSVYDTEELTALELAARTAAKVNEVVEANNSIDSRLKVKEDSTNITNNRKLSPTGNFTGTLAGRAALLVVSGVDDNRSKYKYLADQFADGQTGLVIDGGYFDEMNIKKNLDGGVF